MTIWKERHSETDGYKYHQTAQPDPYAFGKEEKQLRVTKACIIKAKGEGMNWAGRG